jgi:hypothetical protein
VRKFHITKPIQTMEIFKLFCNPVIANNQRPFSTSVNWNLCTKSQLLITDTLLLDTIGDNIFILQITELRFSLIMSLKYVPS